MRRLIAIVLVLALAVSFAGCASKEEKEAAQIVSAQIEVLTDVTLEDAGAVLKAQEAYDSLTEKAQKCVKNYSILETAHAALADIVTGMIDGIGTVTLDSKDSIEAVRSAYDSLPEKARALVHNHTVLETAVAEYSILEQADMVTKMIAGIGTVTLDSEEAILAAQNAYNALPEESKALVENHEILEDAFSNLLEIFSTEMNTLTDAILELNTALNQLDVVTMLALIEEYLPLAEQLSRSSFHVSDDDVVATMTDIRDTITQACYPNTHILSLDNYIKLKGVQNATADSNEGEEANEDEDTGMEFHGYVYDTKTQMNNAFQAYEQYLNTHFQRVRVNSSPAVREYSPWLGVGYTSASARHAYKDDLGRDFYVEWTYTDIDYYGTAACIYVGFAPEVGLCDYYDN